MIPESFLQELLSRVDIVELISKYVPLKRAGKSFVACCPFHKEKSPSFNVSQSKQFFHCFGCGASGNAIGFLMKYEDLSFPEAVHKLAEMYGLQVPEDSGEKRRRIQAKNLYDLMQEACDYYRQCLQDNSRATEYLKNRAIGLSTCSRFGLGYSPDSWQALQTVFGQQLYNSPQLDEKNGCGLVIHSENGKTYDRFRGRIMFPIRNRRGQVIGFGARTLHGDEHPKYLNSPETPIYHKSSEIYGLFEGSDSIRERKRVIVVEGYMDVIQLSQAGFGETVAALGTAITSEHIIKLLRMVDTVYFNFDGDPPGQHALARAMTAALPVVSDTQTLRFVVLPPEHDPDSFIKALGVPEYEKELENSLTLSEFLLRNVKEGLDLSSDEGRSQCLARARPLITSMKNAPLLRAQIVDQLAMIGRTTQDELLQRFGLRVATRQALPLPARQQPRWKNRWLTQTSQNAVREIPAPVADKLQIVLSYLLSHPELAMEFSNRIEEFAGSGSLLEQEITEVWRASCAGEEPLTQTQVLLAALSASPHIALYQSLVAREMELNTPIDVARAEISTAFNRIELDKAMEESREIASSSNPDLPRYQALQTRINTLKKQIQTSIQAQDDAFQSQEIRKRELIGAPNVLRKAITVKDPFAS